MDFILDNIYIIGLLFVGAISQWLKVRGESRQDKGNGYDPEELEKMLERSERRQPRAAVPPPLARASAPPPPLPGSSSSPVPEMRRKSREVAPAFDISGELARQHALAEKVREMKLAKAAMKASDAMPSGVKSLGSASHSIGLGLKARLRDRDELRRAFVLKEILEKPVALR